MQRDASAVHIAGPWTHRDLSANGVRLHVAEAGEGPLVLLLHGFPEFWWAWRAQLPALAAAGFRAVAPDLRGYGGSDKPPRGYDLPTAASDVAALVRALGERDAVVVGHDWGGLVAWTMAALFGLRTIKKIEKPERTMETLRDLPDVMRREAPGERRREVPTVTNGRVQLRGSDNYTV